MAVVIMPDHLHALIAPLDRNTKVTQFSAALKRFVRPENHTWEWQSGVFDRLLRREEKISDKWEYMRDNPVRTGLVLNWKDWPHSIGLKL